MAETIKIGGELESTATGNVVAAASAIKDKVKNKYQSVINAENDIQLASHESRLNAYTEGKFVTVSNYSELPATGAADTVYRVSSWDGTANNGQGAVDVTKYSEYAWQNGAYKFLDVKTQIGEVFDISEYNSGAVYTDLVNALGNNGTNVPSSIRRGGMSVKFKQVITPATYTVVKTEGATEQPTGTELQSDPGIISGTYTAGELSVFSTLPATLNSSLTYYLAVTETVDEQEVTTYTIWVITYVRTSDNKYIQYRLISDEFSTTPSDWQGVDEKPTAYSKNFVESEGVEKTKVTIKPGKNLLNPATCKAGFLINRNTGEEVANANYFVSDFIPVSENGLSCSSFYYGGIYIGAAVYDENKQYIRSAGDTSVYVYQSGDAYIRYTLSGLDTIVEEGNVNTGYEAFNPVGGYIDEKYHKLVSKTGAKITGTYPAGSRINNIWILPIPIGTTIKNNGVNITLNGINDEREVVASGDTYTTAFEVAFIKTSSTAGDVDIDVYGDLSFNDVKGNLPFGRVNVEDNTINGSKTVDKSLGIEKLKDAELVIGVNKLNVNDPDFLYEHKKYIKRTNGTIGSSSTTTMAYGYTGFIPVSKNGLYFNAFVFAGVNIGAAVYDENKQYIRSGIGVDGIYTYQEGDAYIRYSLAQNPVSPYLEGQFQVNEGTTGLPYEEYSQKTVISKDVLPEDIGSITSYEQISDDIKKDIMGYNVDISIPDVIPVVVGDRLQIFWKSIIVAPNPYIYDVYAVSGSKTCKSYPRYLQCDPTAAGNIPITIYVKSPSGLVIKSKAITIKAIAPMTAPVSNTKILVIGDSVTANGYMADELRRRLTTKSGTAILTTSVRISTSIGDTYSINGIILTVAEQSDDVKYVVVSSDEMLDVPDSGTLVKESGSGTASIIYTNKEQKFNNPIGLGLNNFEFVGRKTGTSVPSIHQDATGGWSWGSFAYSGQLAYRFQVTGVNLITIGSTYRDSNSQFVFEVTETNITDRTGNIRCTYTGSGTIPESGTLTLVSGDSDATITYTSFEEEAGNPFWNPVTNKLDFTSYANEYCGGSIDVIISHLGLNGIKNSYTDLQTLFDGPVRDFITAYHAEFPNGKFIFSTLPLGSATGGLGAAYGADYFWNFYTLARALWDYAEFARNYFATNEFDYVYVADVVPIFDCENLFPSTATPVNNRSSVTELLGTNGVHSLEIGRKTIADAIYEKINDVL